MNFINQAVVSISVTRAGVDSNSAERVAISPLCFFLFFFLCFTINESCACVNKMLVNLMF